jgi:chromosome partitioning protein
MSAKIITIAQQKGGSGKTTIAAHLAVAYSQYGKNLAIIDIDPQQTLTMWHNIRCEKLSQALNKLNFVTGSGWRVSNEIARLKNHHDIIIIDSQPHADTEAKAAIRESDLVIIPIQPSPADLWASKATITLAEKENKNIAILLNRMTNNSKLAKEIMANIPYLLDSTLGNRVAFASCLLEGKTVSETDPSGIAAKEINSLIRELNTKFLSTKLT